MAWAAWVGMAMQMHSQRTQGEGASADAKTAYGVAAANEKNASENASRARQDAALAEEAQRRQARKSLGRSAAAAAQSGVSGGGLGGGSTGALLKQAATEAELDALNIRYGGQLEARDHEVEQAQYNLERRVAFQQASGGMLSGLLGAGAAGLSGYADYKGSSARTKYSRPSTTSSGTKKTASLRGAPIGTSQRGARIDPYGIY